MPRPCRTGQINPLYAAAFGSLALLGVIALLMLNGVGGPVSRTSRAKRLTVYCAAGLRPAVEAIAKEYEAHHDVNIQLEYGGSNTLLSRLEVAGMGDLYLAADQSYTDLARKKGLVRETISLAVMRPVILVGKGNPKNIHSIDDLLRPGVRVALGNPQQAAIGKKTKRLLEQSGHWKRLEKQVEDHGVFKPTVPEIANDVKLGSVDASIVWDAVAARYTDLQAIRTPELDAGQSRITVGVVTASKHPTAALKFARYLAARDKGSKIFAEKGYDAIKGDPWAERPKMTFFVGSVNRRALEPILKAFTEREGIEINTVYNGCGILTAQMRAMKADQASGFPDAYMACDVYYLNTVSDLFQRGVNISHTDIVIVVQKGNPKHLESLADLTKPGVRVALGQPDQCTIGVLSRHLLESEGIYQKLLDQNVVTQTATSALLVPSVATGSADAALAYRTDTLAEHEKVDAVAIQSPLAKAVQPYSISLSSPYKQLAGRLYAAIAAGRESFESAGFTWQLDSPAKTD